MSLGNMIGMGSVIGLAEEAAWGEEESPTHWLPIVSHSIKPILDIRDVPYLAVANAQAWHAVRKNVTLSHFVGGDIVGCCAYDSKAVMLLLKHAMGAVATTGPVSTQYTHTLNLDSDGVFGLTGHVVNGSDVALPAETFSGLRIAQLELSVNAFDMLMYRATVIGKAASGMVVVDGTPAVVDAEEVLAHQGSTLSWNAHSLDLRSFKLTINNNLARRGKIGQLYTARPVPGGFGSIDVEATYPWETHDLYTDWLARVKADGTFGFTGTGDNLMSISLQNLQWLNVDKPVNTAGELVQTAVARCYANPSSEQGLRIVVKNSNLTAV